MLRSLSIVFASFTTSRSAQIYEGIGHHLQKQSAQDPLSGVDFKILEVNDEEKKIMDVLDTFPSLQLLKYIRRDYGPGFATTAHPGVEKVWRIMKKQQKASWVVLAITFSLTCAMFPLLEDPVLSVLPIILVIGFGVSVTACGFTFMRVRAINIIRGPGGPDKELVTKAIAQYKTICKIKGKIVEMGDAVEQAMEKHRRESKERMSQMHDSGGFDDIESSGKNQISMKMSEKRRTSHAAFV